jgi:hypothetical protein
MTLPRIASLALCSLAAACAASPPAAPAPVGRERLLAALAASEAAAAAVSQKAPAPAERLAGPLARLDPARIDPRLAERFLSR